MFEQQESDNAEVITEQAKGDTISKGIDTPVSKLDNAVISESTQRKAPVGGYLEELKRTNR
jgi:hypothetical protein